MAITRHRLTFDDFLQLREEKPALEYLDGVVTRKSWSGGPHSRLQVVAARWLDGATDNGCLGWVFTELRTN